MIVPVIMWWDRQVIITRQNMILHICKVMTIDHWLNRNTKLHFVWLQYNISFNFYRFWECQWVAWWCWVCRAGELENMRTLSQLTTVGDCIGDDTIHDNFLKWQYWNVWMSLPKYESKLYVIMYESEAVRPRGFLLEEMQAHDEVKWTNKLSQ